MAARVEIRSERQQLSTQCLLRSESKPSFAHTHRQDKHYEACDEYRDLALYSDARPYQNDIFEISVDAELSGSPFITNPQIKDPVESHFRFGGVHAQNHHIFTPPVNRHWCMVWRAIPWTHSAYDYSFKRCISTSASRSTRRRERSNAIAVEPARILRGPQRTRSESKPLPGLRAG